MEDPNDYPGMDHVSKEHTERIEDGSAANLSPEHRAYLISRHGTYDLDPLPTMDPADPLNWSSWKVMPHIQGMSMS
jgi:hypothetical protein